MSTGVRIRQIVFACEETTSFDTLKTILGLETPFPDPGVAEFGLVNAVFALGDQFVEIVVPTTDQAPARRFLDRSGEGGYMAIFQLPDIEQARRRLDDLGLRQVWNIDLEDISASHIHPADIGGAIVSIDEPRPASAWRWGGPDWQARSASGNVTGITLTAPDPQLLAKRWANALGAELDADRTGFQTEDGPVNVEHGEREAISAYHFALHEPEAALAQAKQAGLPVQDNAITFAGTQLILSAP